MSKSLPLGLRAARCAGSSRPEYARWLRWSFALAAWLGLVAPNLERRPPPAASSVDPGMPAAPSPARRGASERPAAGGPRVTDDGTLAAVKAARVGRILRDYEEMRTQLAAQLHAAGDYEAHLAGNSPPRRAAAPKSDSTALFLRQLALLERERRADLGRVLTPAELEIFERTDSASASRVQQALARSGLAPR